MDGETKKSGDLNREELSKALDESLLDLSKQLQGDGERRVLSKAKKAEEEEEDEDEPNDSGDEEYEGEEEEDENEEEEKRPMKKSLEDFVGDEDPEAEMAMDVAPFLKSLVRGQQKYIDMQFNQLRKSFSSTEKLIKSQGNVLLAQAQLSKSMNAELRAFGDAPQKSSSQLKKSGERFDVAPKPYNKAEILSKSFNLLREGKIDTLMATKIEHRVNAGQELPESVAHLFETESK